MLRPYEKLGEVRDVARSVEAELPLQAQILDQVHDAVVATDLNGRILSWNRGAERLYGYGEEEALGLRIEVLFHPEDRVSQIAHLRAPALASGSHSFVGRFRHRSGVSLHAEVRLALLRDNSGNPVGVVSCSQDVTRRIEQEAELRLQSRVLDSMREAVFLTDPEGWVLYANPAAVRIFQAQKGGLVGKSVCGLFAGFDNDNALADWETIQLTLRSNQDWAGDLECMRSDGERFTSSFSVGVVHSASAVGWVWVLQDITSRKRVEAALRHREQMFRSMAEQAPVMVWTLDSSGVFDYVNAAWRQQWGLSSDEARTGKWRDFITTDTLPNLEEALATAIDYQQPFEAEFRMLDASGDERTVLAHGAPLGVGDSFSGFVGSTTDITAIRQAEASRRRLDRRHESAERLESLGVLAGGIAHDFNNLLVSILGFAELAKEDLPDEHPARSSVEQVEIGARRAAELTQQILTFSGRARAETKTVNLGSLLVEMLQLLENSIADRARLTVQSAAPTQDIEGDPSQVRQVVMNLLLNAADAAEEPAGEVRVRLLPIDAYEPTASESVVAAVTPPPGEYVCIEVTDDGRGMDEDTQRKIFEPFFSTKPSGRGLGLASVLGIVRSHKGGIEVESQPGRGATFRVYFPVAQRRKEPSTEGKLAVSQGKRFRPCYRALLVDDDEAVLETLTTMLERSGYRVQPVADRAEALKVFSESPSAFDVIIFDLTMPGMKTSEALAGFKSINADIPILLASGYSVESIDQTIDQEHGAGFLQKPFERENLLSAIERLVLRRRGDRGESGNASSAQA